RSSLGFAAAFERGLCPPKYLEASPNSNRGEPSFCNSAGTALVSGRTCWLAHRWCVADDERADDKVTPPFLAVVLRRLRHAREETQEEDRAETRRLQEEAEEASPSRRWASSLEDDDTLSDFVGRRSRATT